jgi:HAD superfamily hydrolase (TIGR01509 family)
VKHVVFDFGGVLFQWQPPRLLQRELPHVATDQASAEALATDFFQNYTGDWAEFDRGTVGVPELVARIARRTGLAASDVQRVVDGVPRELQPVPETVDLLRRLRAAGRGLHFLSNMPLPYAQHLEDSHDFVGWFDSGVFSGRERLIKPDAEIFEFAASRFGQPPANLVFLDDHLPNVQAALRLGWQALHFRNAAQVEAELREHGWM